MIVYECCVRNFIYKFLSDERKKQNHRNKYVKLTFQCDTVASVVLTAILYVAYILTWQFITFNVKIFMKSHVNSTRTKLIIFRNKWINNYYYYNRCSNVWSLFQNLINSKTDQFDAQCTWMRWNDPFVCETEKERIQNDNKNKKKQVKIYKALCESSEIWK